MKLWKPNCCCKKSTKVIEPVELPWPLPGPPPKYETSSELESVTTPDNTINANDNTHGIANIIVPVSVIAEVSNDYKEQNQGFMSLSRLIILYELYLLYRHEKLTELN